MLKHFSWNRENEEEEEEKDKKQNTEPYRKKSSTKTK